MEASVICDYETTWEKIGVSIKIIMETDPPEEIITMVMPFNFLPIEEEADVLDLEPRVHKILH
jgi:hypothetical protein